MLGSSKYGYNHAHFFNDFFATQLSLYICVFTGLLYASMFGYLLVNFADICAWVSLFMMQFFLIGGAWMSFFFYHNAQITLAGSTGSQ